MFARIIFDLILIRGLNDTVLSPFQSPWTITQTEKERELYHLNPESKSNQK